MEKKPLILVVNDDGYEARGLEAMVEIAKTFGEVVVVTPDKVQSAMGHAITMNVPLHVRQYKTVDGVQYWRTNGTPVDCVKLGQKVVLRGRKIDLVLSGINHGSNSSVSVIYSGTMGAAIEASFDTAAIGLSVQDYSPNADFTAAVHYGKIIVKSVLEKGLPPHVCLNVNVPKIPFEEIKGMKVTRQTDGYWYEDMEKRVDPYGREYYWLTGYLVNTDNKEDSCEWALQHNFISIQPVHYDLTAYEAMNDIKYLENVQ
ncbi:MAG: 5'/3'-nucleotidase SurE [Bacteroidales bacterium]|jgi:5'-nucleotidase|nr:5'/3'-nucleotidase SurE [Bacteroidales bacterium]MBR3572336.1 5'/3'-nucleotidase SurE [Bacteroidales bacterium]